MSCPCATRLTTGGCICPRALAPDEARDLVRDAALDAAKRMYPDVGELAVRVMAETLLVRAKMALGSLKDRG